MQIDQEPIDDRWEALLPADRRCRCHDALSTAKRNQLILSWLLLRHALVTEGIPLEVLDDVRRTRFGKPFFMHSEIRFNLTHSDGYVAVLLSNTCEVGIDVQRVRRIPARFYEPYFSSSDFQSVQNSASARAWCEAWAVKEAVIKCIGTAWQPQNKKGIHVLNGPPKIDGKNYVLTKKWLSPDDILCACAEDAEEPIELTEVSMDVWRAIM